MLLPLDKHRNVCYSMRMYLWGDDKKQFYPERVSRLSLSPSPQDTSVNMAQLDNTSNTFVDIGKSIKEEYLFRRVKIVSSVKSFLDFLTNV